MTTTYGPLSGMCCRPIILIRAPRLHKNIEKYPNRYRTQRGLGE